jgi:hypothetical protein
LDDPILNAPGDEPPRRPSMSPPMGSRANEGHLDRLDRLRRAPAGLVIAASAVIYAVVVTVDLVTGPDLQLLIFYLVPVLVVAWRFDFFGGEVAAGLVVVGGV